MILTGAAVFDGQTLHDHHAVRVVDGKITGLGPTNSLRSDSAPTGTAPDDTVHTLDGGVLCPGFVDLQVNGGGGVMLNTAPTIDSLRTMISAHAALGATSLLPTLITANHDITRGALDAVCAARAAGMAGIAGLHLEGPHLTRAGAHDPALLRPMNDADLALYCGAVDQLGVLKITLAPELVTPQQIRTLAGAGVLVALGHTDADYDTCRTAIAAGASMVTHLFNAMSGLTHRAPGCVGAALSDPHVAVGLIADGHHVHRDVLGMVWRGKMRPGPLYLVSDAMAVAGTDDTGFMMDGHWITRRDGRLTLPDGTLAGADLDLARAIRTMRGAGVPLVDALAMATRVPADLIGRPDLGRIALHHTADLVHLDDAGQLRGVWRAGEKIA